MVKGKKMNNRLYHSNEQRSEIRNQIIAQPAKHLSVHCSLFTIHFFVVFVFCFSLFNATFAVAGPARRGFFTRTQPDGTEIRLQLVGDEFAHAFATPDGQLVRRDTDGFFKVLSETEERDFYELWSTGRQAGRSASQRAGRRVASYRMDDFPNTGNIHGIVLLWPLPTCPSAPTRRPFTPC